MENPGTLRQLIDIPRDASDGRIMAIIRTWVDILAGGEYELVGSSLGYAMSFGEPHGACIHGALKGYLSPGYYPGVEHFTVSDWRVAAGGNHAPKRMIRRYEPNASRLAGVVEFDLPLNGRWSDLTAEFAWFADERANGGYRLTLETISSLRQLQCEADEVDAAFVFSSTGLRRNAVLQAA